MTMVPVAARNCRLRIRRLLRTCVDSFDETEGPYEAAVGYAFHRFRRNTDRGQVGAKVAVLNALYGTAIRDTGKLADHIYRVGHRLDDLLKARDLRAISLVANGHGIHLASQKNDWELLSFATKYCHWHEPGHYPIYDSFAARAVARLLGHVRPADCPSQEQLSRPDRLVETLGVLKSETRWPDRGFKEIDKALWILGQTIYYAEHSRTREQREDNREYECIKTSLLPGFLTPRRNPWLEGAWTCAGHD